MKETLTKKEEALMDVVSKEWIDNALHKGGIDKEEAEAGIKWLYYISELKEPKITFVKGLNDFWDKVGAKVRDKAWAKVWDSFSWVCQSGDSGWGSWAEYYLKIGILDGKEDGLREYLGYLKSGAFFVSFWEDEVIVMERPNRCEFNENDRLHSVTGPALAWPDGTELYYLNDIEFDKELWQKVVSGKMPVEDIFAIENAEQRRVAYEVMDKSRIKELKDFKVLDEIKDDGYGYPMKVVEFKVKQFDEPLRYLNCFCPSTGREYYIETRQDKCELAKAKSFGLEKIKFNVEL